MRELHTVNQLTLRKMQGEPSQRSSKLKISDDSLQLLIELEDKVKLENKRTQEHQRQGAVLQQLQARADAAIEDTTNQTNMVKEATGWDRHEYGARGFTNEENKFREHQKTLSTLEERQQNSKNITLKLTQRIEELTSELEKRKDLDDEFVKAMWMLKEKQGETAILLEDKKSLGRIMHKKTKMLHQTEQVDDYKQLRQLEGDKRTLHHELGRIVEQKKTNEKSILSQDVRLQQLYHRLETTTAFLKGVFADIDESELLRTGLKEGDTTVPVLEFDSVQAHLTLSRNTIELRDKQLTEVDASIEALDKKATVLHCAMMARSANASQMLQELEREKTVLNSHVDSMQLEYEAEYERLTKENESLRLLLAQQRRPGIDAA